ncbi:DUF302 domain-containing protein [Helicovermis profundi]|uniref:DUF302 domain-containing protein n=1 Tax=Helicovermis profundi TaxID=3065157 RepID=A0AAU9E3R5_9FIRM|nr:DUF302 domain-containing protein [Clostridia bacterium S502]
MNLLYEKKSTKDINETLKDIKEELTKIGFGVLFELNFKEKLKEKGLNYDYNYYVLEVCNPPKAQKILENDQKIGYFLPCKIVLYETESEVIIGISKPTTFIKEISNSDVVFEKAKEVEDELINAINLSI